MATNAVTVPPKTGVRDIVRLLLKHRISAVPVLDGRRTGRQALERLSELVTLAPFSNGFTHGREGAAWIGTDEI